MSNLKTKNMEKCVSLLRDFINDVPEINNKKSIAILALNQLQNITAGTGIDSFLSCNDRPRINESPGVIGG